MNEVLWSVFSLVAGVSLGAFFFGGLWWTVRRGVSSKCAPLWFLASLLVRTAVVLIGFHVVSACHWERLLACLLGFVLARVLMTGLARKTG